MQGNGWARSGQFGHGEDPDPRGVRVRASALGFLVGKAAVDVGHEVSFFLAGDAVQLLREGVLDNLSGLGTGSLRDSYDAVLAGGGRFYVSGMSSKARGFELDGIAEAAIPDRLVELALEHDRILTH